MTRHLDLKRTGAALLVLGLVALAAPACSDKDSDGGDSGASASSDDARAFRIARREQLIGGRRALGAPGDYMLSNDRVRVIVQDIGFSRGFGVFGGGIIDMDLRRADERPDLQGTGGRDMFGETFPGFFLQALNPERVEILSDGTGGGPARLRVSGYAGDFLTLIKGLNEQLLRVFQGQPEGQVSTLSCALGRFDGQLCQPDHLDGTLVERCEAPGGLVCSAQCQREARTNAAGDIVGYNWRLPGTGLACNPGVYDDATCSCLNDGAPVPVEDQPGVSQLAELCPDWAGPFCDPGCPDSGELTTAGGDAVACQRGVFDPTSCSCQAVAGGGSGNLCIAYCPGGEQNPTLGFSVEYALAPGERYIEVTAGLTNMSSRRAEFPFFGPISAILGVPDGGSFPVPMGDVHLFSAGNHVFAPGAGFDLRGNFDEVYGNAPALPALPGFPVDFLATVSDQGVSYGVIVAPSERNFGYLNREQYGAVGDAPDLDDMIVPFSFSAFVGTFYATLPERLEAGESFEFTKYFVIGNGDVGSVLDGIYEVRREVLGMQLATGRFEGQVFDETTLRGVDDAWVLLYKRRDASQGCAQQDGDVDPLTGRLDGARFMILSQYTTRNGGRFGGELEAGCYAWRVLGPERSLSAPSFGEVREDKTRFETLTVPPTGRLDVLVVDEAGHGLPAKVTVVGTYDDAFAGMTPGDFLHDLSAGERLRATDLVTDVAGERGTLRYIEQTAYTDAQGRVSLALRPTPGGHPYSIFVSRGTEYELFEKAGVVVEANGNASVRAALQRVVDTRGWVAGDFHLHTMGSIDSSSPEAKQVQALAGEGVEVVAVTDHNYVNDLTPAITAQGLAPFLTSVTGLELTTVEGGHFNGFPLRFEPETVLHGSFEWSGRPPGEIFEALRARGVYGPDETIVQVNHPRDTILGYFDQYGVNNLTLEPQPGTLSTGLGAPGGPAFIKYDALGMPLLDEEGDPVSQFSFDFDAIEIFNGKRFTQIHAVRSYDPADCATGDEQLPYLPPTQSCRPPGELPETLVLPPKGVVVLEDDGQVAFPGNVEDWFNLLATGRPVVGVANSDSHKPWTEEPGFPRTYVRVGVDRPDQIDPRQLVRSMKSLAVTSTNGPFVELFAGEAGIGETAVAGADGVVRTRVRIQAPQWIGVDLLVLYVNGIERERRVLERAPGQTEILVELDLALERDAFIVAEVTGRQSLFPVVPPLEIPPLLLTEAVGAIGGAFGIGAGPWEALRPDEVRHVTPWSMTNPVFVDVDGGGYAAPGAPLDRDGDTVLDADDNCPLVSNVLQEDGDADGSGDACADGSGASGSLEALGATRRLDEARIRRPEADHEKHLLDRQAGSRRDLRSVLGMFGHDHDH